MVVIYANYYYAISINYCSDTFSLRVNLGWIRKDFNIILLLYFQFNIPISYAIVILTVISKFLSKHQMSLFFCTFYHRSHQFFI